MAPVRQQSDHRKELQAVRSLQGEQMSVQYTHTEATWSRQNKDGTGNTVKHDKKKKKKEMEMLRASVEETRM